MTSLERFYTEYQINEYLTPQSWVLFNQKFPFFFDLRLLDTSDIHLVQNYGSLIKLQLEPR